MFIAEAVLVLVIIGIVIMTLSMGPSAEDDAPEPEHVDYTDRREVQSYLMESWERQFERAVGADVIRDEHEQAQRNLQDAERRKRSEYEHLFPSRVFGSAQQVRLKFPTLAAEIDDLYEDMIDNASNHAASALRAYNTRMGKRVDEPLPKWRHDA